MLLPALVFSQNLVTWNNLSTPTGNAANITAAAISSNNGVTIENNGWSGYRINGIQTGLQNNAILYSKYVQFAVTVPTGYKMNMSQFSFTYRSPNGNDGPKKMQIRYSTNPAFPSNGTLLGAETNLNQSNNNDYALSFSFPANTEILGSNTLYIRMYVYGQNNSGYGDFYLRNTTFSTSTQGPRLTGTVSAYSTVLLANNDNTTVNLNQTTAINVTSNDVAGSAAINSVSVASAPSNGTATVNGLNINYTPNSGYVGSDSFTYTANNGTDPSSTATVNITVAATTPTGPLNGTYYIGTSGHFTTITSAVTYLNANGVSGPVTFLLTNTLYNNASGESFPITITNFTGSSATNTVTFKPNASTIVNVEANNVNNYTGVPAIFYLNGADYITFDGSNVNGGTSKNFTLNNKCNVNYVERSVIWVASNGGNASTYITVKNMNLRQANKNQGGNFCTGVYSGNNGIGGNNTMNVSAAAANNRNLTVVNNKFMNVKQGVYVNGGTTRTTNVIIHQNDLGAETNTETIIQPAYLSNVNVFEYTENRVYNLYRDTNAGDLRSAGIHIANNTTNGSILRNQMRDLTRTTTDSHTFAGIILESTNNNSNILVANNFILNVAAQGNGGGANNGHGIYVGDGGGYSIYHNTVKLQTNQTSGGRNYSACLYIESGVTGLNVRNNIFVNAQTNTATERFAIAVISPNASTFTNLNYNDYFSTKFIGHYGGGITNGGNPNAQTTLGGWQSASGADANSISVNPIFVSATDLHIDQYNEENAAFNNLGTPAINATVPKDIDGQIRNTTTPDMGADEFGPISMPTPGDPAGIYCASATTWNGTAWSNGNPASDKDVIFSGNFTQTGGTFEACSVFVLDGASVNFISNANAVVVHSVNVEEGGALTFESGSNLTQVENDGNSGIVTVKRNGSMLKRLDYSIWGSPVTGTQTLLDFSPNTVANRFYVYQHTTNSYLPVDPETTTFKAGKGYLIRMPNGYPNNGATAGYNAGTTAVSFEGVFEGTPNNGNVRIPLDYTSTNLAYNAVANPYPSPINVRDFIDENIDNIEGTVWVWRKSNNPEASTYWVINKAGATVNEATGGSNPLVADPADFSNYTTAFLNTGQGFIVKALTDEDLVFTNAMRKTHNSTYFFRTAAETEETAPSRFWLNVTNAENNAFSQAMVGYFDGATNGYDNGYDGKSLLEGNTRLYSIAYDAQDTLRLALQARSAFTIADVVPLGFSATVAGSFEITIDHADGIFTGGQDIYVVDRYTNVTHNLKDGNYTFTTEPGTFEDRFQIIYTTEEVLDNDNPIVNTADVVVYRNGSQVGITAPRTIQSVEIYDMLGRVIYQNNNVNDTEFTSSALNTTQQVIIVRATLDNQQVVSKKIMLN